MIVAIFSFIRRATLNMQCGDIKCIFFCDSTQYIHCTKLLLRLAHQGKVISIVLHKLPENSSSVCVLRLQTCHLEPEADQTSITDSCRGKITFELCHAKNNLNIYFTGSVPLVFSTRLYGPRENVSSGLCGQRRPISACASAQSDHGLHYPVT